MVSAKNHFLFVALLALALMGGLNASRYWPWSHKPKAPQAVKPFANDLVLGVQGPQDVTLYANYNNRTGVPNQILYADIVYTGYRNITRIRALDLAINGTGGFARITSGGLGQKNVTIQLSSSQASRGYYFYVDIYGY